MDSEVAVLQVHVDLIFLKTGQVYVQLVGGVRLPDVGFHQVLAPLAVQGIPAGPGGHTEEVIVKEIVE